MGRVKGVPSFSEVATWQELRRYASIAIERIMGQINGGLSFGENLTASGPSVVTFASASDIQQVNHSLGRVPDGFIVIKLNAAITVYQPSGNENAWQSDKIFLRASGAGTATLYVV